MSPRLSVVVPYHNVESYIGECLASLAHQTLTDLEVILVDDGSTDHSRDVAQHYCASDSRFVLVTQENQGLGPARNTGARRAQGEFLTFVDSDDLVPWGAYDLMVRTLEETGSSFAAGNARRFSRSRGVWQSWAHRDEFAGTALATHILERPGLAFDRMIWNKVFRRDFYQARGFEFPPIRYEDYPVSLRAHLDALTVDVLADPSYFWRDRESGDSITQQGFRYDNLLDRVRSAEMVLDVAARAGSPVRAAVHQHLAHIDLVVLTQAFEVVPEVDVERLLALGHRLFDRLDPAALAQRPPFEQIQHAALRASDIGLLRELARFRSGTDPGDTRLRRNPSRPWVLEADYPRSRGSQVPQSLYRLPRSEIRPITEVHDVRLRDGLLTLRGVARLSHLDADERDELSLSLVRRAGSIPVPLSDLTMGRTDGGRSCWEFQGEVDISRLGSIPSAAWPLPFAITLRHGLWYRRAPLRGVHAGSPTLPDGLWVKPDVWVQWAQIREGGLALVRTTRPVVLESVETDAGGFSLRIRAPEYVEQGWIEIGRGDRPNPHRVQVTVTPTGEGSVLTARVPLAELVSEQVPQDPYHLRSAWGLRLVDEYQTRQILWTGRFTSIDIPHRHEVVSMRATPYRWVEAVREPARSRVDSVEVSQTDITVEGAWWSQAAPVEMSWRRFQPGSDDHVDVPCALDLRPGRFIAAAPLLRLAAAVNSGSQRRPLHDWSLFTRTASGDDAVVCSAAAGAALPRTAVASNHRLRVVMVRDTIHVEVRPHA